MAATTVEATNMTTLTNQSYVDLIGEISTIYAVIIPTFCIITVIGNLATIVAFCRECELWERPSEVLIFSLSCADFGTGLLVLPLYSPVYLFPNTWPFGEIACEVFIFLLDVTVHASILTLLSISLDRFLLVYKEYPMYLKLQTLRKITLAIVLIWSIAIMTGIVELTLWEVAKTWDQSASEINYTDICLSPARRVREYSLVLFLVFYFIPAILMCLLSIAFLCLLGKRLDTNTKRMSKRLTQWYHNTIEMQSKTSLAQPKQSVQTKNRYTRPAVTLIALVSAMAICMLPYCCLVIWMEVFCSDCTYPYKLTLFKALLFLQFCNACLDPFLYALTQRKIREYYIRGWNTVRSRCITL